MQRIFRTDKSKGGFTQYDNHIWETNLSNNAKVYWFYLLSRVDTWEFNRQNVMSVCNLSDKPARKVLNELEEAGYIKRERHKNEKGQIVWTKCFYEHPDLQKPCGTNDHMEQSEEKEPYGTNDHMEETQQQRGFEPECNHYTSEENHVVQNHVVENHVVENHHMVLYHHNNIGLSNTLESKTEEKRLKEGGNNTLSPYIDKHIEIVEQQEIKTISPIVTDISEIKRLRLQHKTEEQGEIELISHSEIFGYKEPHTIKLSKAEQLAKVAKDTMIAEIFIECANQKIGLPQEWIRKFIYDSWDTITKKHKQKEWVMAAMKRHAEEEYKIIRTEEPQAPANVN